MAENVDVDSKDGQRSMSHIVTDHKTPSGPGSLPFTYSIPIPDLPTVGQWYQFIYDSRLGQSIRLIDDEHRP